jgi:hypothetical protein
MIARVDCRVDCPKTQVCMAQWKIPFMEVRSPRTDALFARGGHVGDEARCQHYHSGVATERM